MEISLNVQTYVPPSKTLPIRFLTYQQTPLTPDYTPETVTCSSWPQDKMYSGDWSLVVISNNGETGDPIAYQRDFSLSVGTPSTTTFTPTITQTDVETSVYSIYSTTTSTITTTLVPSTVTKQQLIAFAKPTLTSQPFHVQVVTENLFTLTQTQYQPSVVQTTVSATPSCASPTPNWIADPIAKIEITIINTIAQKVNSAKFKRAISNDAELKRDFVAERSARIAQANKLGKRAPDASVSTVTATTSLITSTETQYTTVTSTFPTTSLITRYAFPSSPPPLPSRSRANRSSTSTPAPVTVTQALLDFAALQTEVLGAWTFTITDYEIAHVTETKSVPWTVTHTSTMTDGAAVAECTSGGGTVV